MTATKNITCARRLALATILSCGLALLTAVPATASTPEPVWSIQVTANPTNLAPGSSYGSSLDDYLIVVKNIGGAPSDGTTPITLTDALPPGVTLDPAGPSFYQGDTALSCSATAPTCTDSQSGGPIYPGQQIYMFVPVDVSASPPATVTDTAEIDGGGAASATTSVTTSTSATPAAFGLESFGTQITNADGSADSSAGSHPYQMTVDFNLNDFYSSGESGIDPAGDAKDVTVNLPRGMIVNPGATAIRCTETQLEGDASGGGCPAGSAVGYIVVTSGIFGPPYPFISPLYNMVPPPGTPAEFGFDALGAGIYVHLMGSVRTGSDYGLTTTSDDILQKGIIDGISATLWGDPSDPSHDHMRGQCAASGSNNSACPIERQTTPLLTMPSACSGPLTTTISASSWQDPGSSISDSAQTLDQFGQPVGVSGCDALPFDPTTTVQPDTSVADSPSGLHIDFHVPQPQNVNGLAEANLKNVTLTLPEGMSVSPSAANGLVGCSEAQIGWGNSAEPACPDASKIGTVQVTTPLLPDPMTGGIYVAQQGNAGPAQGSNPFGSLLAIYVTAEADGALIKLAARVQANPLTGQLTATDTTNPELPFSDLQLTFFGGPGGVLTTPPACGSYTSTASLAPWSGTPAVTGSAGSFTIDSGCAASFSPSFTAGSQSAQAGAYTPFALTFSRQDTDQPFAGLSVKLPPGMLAKLAGVGECSDAQLAAAAGRSGTAEQASPSCPAGSQVGTAESAAGSGPNPYFLPGKVYLTGPYKGAPYGLAVVVPAVAGPYDLGTVVVRQALYIDPTTAQVTAVSDPFPTILQGIPLLIRRIDVDLNRPGFTVNPTSCDPMAVTGRLSSTGGMSSKVSSRFQVGGCASLAFKPKLKMALTGKGQTKSGDHPTLTSTLTQPSGQANISHVRVALPLNFALDPNNSQNVCPYSIASKVTTGPANCPASTLVGHATAVTPLLSKTLSGPVYLVQGLSFKGGVETHTLPTLLIPLRGQIALDLRAQTSVSHNKLVTTFPTIPDAAVSKFTLTINGGKKGILVITGRGRSICGKPQITDATLSAQSGKATYPNIKMSTPCRASGKHGKHHRHHR